MSTIFWSWQSDLDQRVTRSLIRDALASAIAVPVTSAEPSWQPAHAKSRALWFDPAEFLTINDSGAPGTKQVHPGPYAYVRIVPATWSVPSNFAQDGAHPAILGPTQGYSWGSVRGGFLTYSGRIRSGGQRPLTNFAVQFRSTGEIWGVSPFTTSEDGDRFFADAFISHAHKFIQTNVEYLIGQGARGPFAIRMGATDLKGLHWTTETRFGGRPVALEEQVEASFILPGNSKRGTPGRSRTRVG